SRTGTLHDLLEDRDAQGGRPVTLADRPEFVPGISTFARGQESQEERRGDQGILSDVAVASMVSKRSDPLLLERLVPMRDNRGRSAQADRDQNLRLGEILLPYGLLPSLRGEMVPNSAPAGMRVLDGVLLVRLIDRKQCPDDIRVGWEPGQDESV